MAFPPRRTATAVILVILLAWCAAGCGRSRTPSTRSQPRDDRSNASSTASHSASALLTPSTRSGRHIAVPGYVTPIDAPYWTAVVGGAPTVTGVILNPDNGPGATARPVYRQLIDRLHVAGVHVLGYVRTGFGGRDAAAVENDIDHWRQWYGIADIFLDEAAATTSAVSTYSRFATLIHHSGGRVVLNPGVVPARQYFAFADGVVTFEDSASGYLQPPVGTPGWLRDEPQAKVWNIVIDTPGAQLDDVLHAVRAHHAGVIFVTDATVPNPYDQLPAYWAREVSAVARM